MKKIISPALRGLTDIVSRVSAPPVEYEYNALTEKCRRCVWARVVSENRVQCAVPVCWKEYRDENGRRALRSVSKGTANGKK